jgi:hypothetical protein
VRGAQGAGLGPAIAKGIVEADGGVVGVQIDRVAALASGSGSQRPAPETVRFRHTVRARPTGDELPDSDSPYFLTGKPRALDRAAGAVDIVLALSNAYA